MFNRDTWQEIWHTLSSNKLRTLLTMFGVFWGIYMLMLLTGSGKGLENGVTDEFSGDAYNSVYMWTQTTTMPYKGLLPNRRFEFSMEDMEAIRKNISEVAVLAPQNQLGGYRGGNNVSRNNKTGAFSVRGDYPELRKIQFIKISKGRFVNARDIEENRKVAVIGLRAQQMLFLPGEDPIGQYIKINGVFFQVIGIRESTRTGDRAMEENSTIYIPFTTFQVAFKRGNSIGWFAFTPKAGLSAASVETKLKRFLGDRHMVHPEDVNAIGSWNSENDYKRVTGMFAGVQLFNWIVGAGTLLAGLIGVSNIMLISVNDRVKEIGVRKALGATPWKIVSTIVLESVFITLISGYVGLFLGFTTIEGVSWLLSHQPTPPEMFKNPEINVQSALLSLVILVFGGILAGIIPARKAASILPVEALRYE